MAVPVLVASFLRRGRSSPPPTTTRCKSLKLLRSSEVASMRSSNPLYRSAEDHRPTVRITRPWGKPAGKGRLPGVSAMLRRFGFTGQDNLRIFVRLICWTFASFVTVLSLGARTRSARSSAARLSIGRRFHTSTPCVITVVLTTREISLIPRAAGARFGCPASTKKRFFLPSDRL